MRGVIFSFFFLAAIFSSLLSQPLQAGPPGTPVQSFDGTASQTTALFTVADKWEVRFHSVYGMSYVSVLAADGTVVAGGAGTRSAFYVPKGGTYTIQVDYRFRSPSYMSQPSQPPNSNQNMTGFQTTINGGGIQQNPSSPPNNGYPSQNGSHGSQNSQALAQAGKHWWVEVVEMSSLSPSSSDAQMYSMINYALPGTLADAPAAPLASATFPSPSPSATVPPATPLAAPVAAQSKLTEDQARAVVLIKGDNAEGTGFMIRTMDGPAVITNIHVIANNPNLKITTNTGALVTVLSEKGASDRDLAILSIQDAGYSYLQFSPDISKNVQPGDEVVTPGNSQGGEVMLNTSGKVLGIGPVRIEFDNPIYHGNSGGPVFHPKSGKVLGVVTEAMKVDTTDDLDKASFASRNSAISGSMRYFGLRLDTVAAWIPIDSKRFQIETTFLDEFHEQSRRLDAYLNHGDNDRAEATRLFHSDAKIMKANDNYLERSAGSDTAQHIDLIRTLVFDLQCVADIDMDQIRDKNNFYKFDQDRAQDEYAYRAALKKELDAISNNVQRASFLPRSNN